jgi:hypothetical protein
MFQYFETFHLTAAPTVDHAGAYAAGDLIGGKLTLSPAVRLPGFGGIITRITLSDKAKQNAPIDVVLFVADPDATTFTDQAALDIDDADLLNSFHVSILATDYASFADNSEATVNNVGAAFRLAAGSKELYAALVCRGTPTYAAAGDLQLTVAIAED